MGAFFNSLVWEHPSNQIWMKYRKQTEEAQMKEEYLTQCLCHGACLYSNPPPLRATVLSA